MAGNEDHILLVENDPDLSDLIDRRTLRPLGYDVKVVIDAARAIEAARQREFDLIIADLSLPDLDGMDLLAALTSQGVHAPVVVIVPKGKEARAIQAFRLGAVDALMWPAKDTEITRVVERAVQPQRSQRARRMLRLQVEALQDQIRKLSRDLLAIQALARAASSGGDEERFFSRVLESAALMSGAEIAWLTVRDEDSGSQVLRAQRGLPVNWASRKGKPIEDDLSTLVMGSGQTLLIHGKAFEQFKIAALGRSAAVVPARSGDKMVGLLVVIRKADTEIDAGARAMLETMADLLAVSLSHKRVPAAKARPSTVRGKTGPLDPMRETIIESLEFQKDRLKSLGSGAKGELSAEQKDTLAETESSIYQLMGLLTRGIPLDPAKKQ